MRFVGRVPARLGIAYPAAAQESRGDAVGANGGSEDDRQSAAIRLARLADMRGQPIELAMLDILKRTLDFEENSAAKVDFPLLLLLAPKLVGVYPPSKRWGQKIELTACREPKLSFFL